MMRASFSLPAEPAPVPQVEFVASVAVSGELVEFNDWRYFAGSDGNSGFELWRTNGIDTTLIKDINRGDGSSDPTDFTPFEGYLYFSAYEESTGRELWRTNGAETTLVKDLVPGGDGEDTTGSGSSNPGGFTEFNGWLYLKVFTMEPRGGRFSITTDELWRTNGVDMERFMVVESSYVLYYHSYELAVFNGYLYFSAFEDSTGRELWRTDGIDAPELFADINPGQGSSEPPLFRRLEWEFTEFDGYLYFAANDDAVGTELRRTNGFEVELVDDINQILCIEGDPNSGTRSSLPQSLRVFDGHLYFKATDDITRYQLWQTDGVVTTRMTDFPGLTE
jgi:ELWxxDGT repeat protein